MKKKILILIILSILLNNSLVYAGDRNRGEYDLIDYLEYKMHKLEIEIASKVLANHMYKRVLYWKKQPKPKPMITDTSFDGRS